MNHPESAHQRALIQWWKVAHKGLGIADERLLFSIPNGGRRTGLYGSFLVKEGLRAGVPDLFLSVARGVFHGLYLELKSETGQVRPFQREVIGLVKVEGYQVVVCKGFDAAREAVEAYLKL